jgi:sugar/nucleoside kinase (ribokinase family)
MFDVISIGSVIRDIIFKTSKSKIPSNKCGENEKQPLICFRYGVKINPDQAFFLLGGGGNNTALSFTKLGLKTALFSKIGRDGTGQLITKELKRKKINTSLIKIDPKMHTALSFIIVGEAGERTIFPYAGASGDMALDKFDEKKLSKTRWFYVTTLREKSQKILPKINDLVKKYNIKLAFNPGSTELEKGLKYLKNILKNTEVLILNKEEALELILPKNQFEDDIFYLLSTFKKYGSKIIVITDGENGAWAIDKNLLYQIPAYQGKIVEKTGAGDAFGSGFVAGLVYFNDIKKALELANANASSVISKFGSCPGLLEFKEAQKLIKKYSSKHKVKEHPIKE